MTYNKKYNSGEALQCVTNETGFAVEVYTGKKGIKLWILE